MSRGNRFNLRGAKTSMNEDISPKRSSIDREIMLDTPMDQHGDSPMHNMRKRSVGG